MKRIQAMVLGVLGLLASVPAFANDTVYYYYNDAQGSPVAVTDASGNVVERTQYAPYGEVLNRPEHDGPGYTKHEEDAATGLTNMQQRYDDKAVGRMLSMDPVDVNTATGSNFNRYAYANDNPYRYGDPDGRNVTEALGGLAVESWNWINGDGFNGASVYGALRDGYNGEGGGRLSAALQDLGTASVVTGGIGALRAVGSLVAREGASEGLGVVYKRINPHTLEEYVGKAKSFARYLARQGEHDRALGVKHEYEILGRAAPGKELSYLEETQIRANGGLQKEGGTLANKIHAMSQKNFEGFQGVFRVEGRIDSINLAKKLDGG